jgi:creatinine amidohydrolase
MLWMELTSERFGRAIEESEGVCLLPIGCIERHGPHLPLGCDTITVEAVARRAAEEEPVVVFPALYLSQIAEARHEPGCISLDHNLLLRLLQGTLDEIGRNGFSKILIYNGHGGNTGLIGYLTMSMLQERRSYVLYNAAGHMLEEDRQKWREMVGGKDGHAGISETSLMLHIVPEAVHLEDFTDPADAASRGWLKELTGAHNSFGWYSDHPTHIAGDPRAASAEKGEFLLEAAARSLVKTIREVKADDVSARLARDFYDAAERAGRPKS